MRVTTRLKPEVRFDKTEENTHFRSEHFCTLVPVNSPMIPFTKLDIVPQTSLYTRCRETKTLKYDMTCLYCTQKINRIMSTNQNKERLIKRRKKHHTKRL